MGKFALIYPRNVNVPEEAGWDVEIFGERKVGFERTRSGALELARLTGASEIKEMRGGVMRSVWNAGGRKG